MKPRPVHGLAAEWVLLKMTSLGLLQQLSKTSL